MSVKKLVLLTPSLETGGLQKSISLLANYFAETGSVEVHLVLFGISKHQFYPLNEKVHVHAPSFDFNNHKRFYYTLKTMLFLRGQIKALKPDSILSYGEYWNSFVLLSLFGLSYPVFISDRCQPDKSLGRLHNWLRKVLYPGATGIISQTSTARDIYSRIIRHSNIEVIGNPIQAFASSEDVQKENIIFSVGRLIPSKHHDLLIDIFLASYQSGWKLVIAGGDVAYGNLFRQLSEKIIALNAEDKIVLAGNISNMDEYYQKSKVFAFTSSSEGFPNVIGEAMAAGLPVIAFDCVAGPSDMIEDGKNGFLIPLFDQKMFVEKLCLLMNGPQLREQMGAAAIESIQRFSPEIIGQKYNNFLFRTETV
jgi:GalNAc-alpha-(1->4)-GalNAc-alpha-(1->3)-diNAcBac-PP-undecaprenol alpha-1,4-N-acetyl-D-galactosaminyltransferase